MKFNAEQSAAIQSTRSRVAVIAGAGTGKTATIIGRYAQMLKTIKPEHIVIVTFTVRSAGELKRRIEVGMLPEPGYVGTIHGWCAKFLPPDIGVAPERVTKMVEERACEIMAGEAFPTPIEIATGEGKNYNAYQFYRSYLERNALVDYDMLLDLALQVFSRSETESSRLHVIVDEYQDTGPVERQIYALFGSVFAVGDPRQTLYGWRGACGWDQSELDGWEVHQLSETYRVPSEIVKRVNTIPFPFTPLSSARDGGEYSMAPLENWITRNGLVSGVVLCRSNKDVSHYSRVMREKGWPIRTAVDVSSMFEQYTDYLAARLSPSNNAIVEAFLRKWDPGFDEIKALADKAMVGIAQIATLGEPDERLLAEESVAEMIRLYPDEQERLMAMLATRYNLEEGPGFLVTTVHQAKGLEWDNVCFVAPSWFADNEDNRMILYVAMTRAKQRFNLDLSQMKVAPRWLGV